ncbi:MAG: hypothetical protein NC923_06270, partial [Candidatus Omnitrophica bacterium]|nr:hypothetical protein [Candidatus Omnitrophota bacterium]
MKPVEKILFITLSNIGDVVLGLPVFDCLKANFPQAKFTVLVGERPKEIFGDNPSVEKIIVYNKRSPLSAKIELFYTLKKEKFDIVVDLRNTLFSFLLPAPYKTSPFLIIPKTITHMKDRHLYRLINPKSRMPLNANLKIPRLCLTVRADDQEYIDKLLFQNNISRDDSIILLACGGRSHTKIWPQDNFVTLIYSIVDKLRSKVILVGDNNDAAIARYIIERSEARAADLTAKTTIRQLACLLKRSSCVIANDSAVLHMASYLNIPVLGIFGPTDDLKYGPWSDRSIIIKKDIFCRPCKKAQCRFKTLTCLRIIRPEDVLEGVFKLLSREGIRCNRDFKRILVVRTDRIGDVLLSTPVVKALRQRYPDAYIGMMVSCYARDIVEGNPYIDEAIIYDKDKKHRGWWQSLRFARQLKKKKFELAIILHPTNRAHLLTFFAGIKKRIGYNRKMGFLLTDRLEHTKQYGLKHEMEYNLDLLRYLGIEPKDKELFMPIKKESEEWVERVFNLLEIKASDKLLAIHPGASCPSKIWPKERFAQAADKLADAYGFKIMVVSGPKDTNLADKVV